ncbi:KIAA0930 [Cordylochernes scorpioides]|uniref:KIAA0930 n=1 Tax=Cordylochernes scorpioides TaxID=51811 RepID=A0ABY6K1U1_9ARAC|nr:KIAA0930 [Cordylochernes scorpioides]
MVTDSCKNPTQERKIWERGNVTNFLQLYLNKMEAILNHRGFVILHRSTFWTDLFVRHFICNQPDQTRDDLLFFVRKTQKKTSARYFPQFQVRPATLETPKVATAASWVDETFGCVQAVGMALCLEKKDNVSKLKTELEVYRRDSKKLPIGDTEIDWEETVYLNLIVHQLDYTLTCAICTRTSSKDLQVIRKSSIKVYASPSRRSMEYKGEQEEITYPNIYFLVENYDEDIVVRDGEMLCVELLAQDAHGQFQGVIFLGSLHYESLRQTYDARGSLSSRLAHRMGWGPGQQRREYVRMKGPLAKGHAEMALCRQKGTGAETPTSEPGFCISDFDWEEDLEENPYIQRRMSDPSSNLNTFIRGSWRGGSTQMKKSHSENEGVDCCAANGIREVEACDIRDGEECGELGDGTYNRLWMMRGFSQAYHFWKESRRASSPALHTWVTFVTLPWHSIIADMKASCEVSGITLTNKPSRTNSSIVRIGERPLYKS